jgi:hypothetical protein
VPRQFEGVRSGLIDRVGSIARGLTWTAAGRPVLFFIEIVTHRIYLSGVTAQARSPAITRLTRVAPADSGDDRHL